jgi:hypothetical protein
MTHVPFSLLKTILISFIFLVTVVSANAQTRRDFKRVRQSTSKESEYSSWSDTNASLVYNLKSGTDSKIYWNEKVFAFRSVMDAQRQEFAPGVNLSLLMVLDDAGQEYALMIFDNGEIVLYNDKRGSSLNFSK